MEDIRHKADTLMKDAFDSGAKFGVGATLIVEAAAGLIWWLTGGGL